MGYNLFLRLTAEADTSSDDFKTIEGNTLAALENASTYPIVAGDSQDTDFSGLIQVLAYDHQLGQQVANFPAAGVASHNTFFLQKNLDKSSVVLADLCNRGVPLRFAILYVVDDETATGRKRVLNYLMFGVVVALFQHTSTVTGTATNPPLETLQLAYRAIRWIDPTNSLDKTADRLWINSPP